MKQTFTLVAALLLAPLVGLDAAERSRPNILHIHADDHRPDGLHALGNPLLVTPNLDTLVERGMTFTRAYTMGSMICAVCTPSRTMMLTGRSWQRIPGAPGATPNAKDPMTFLPRVIQAAGYQTWHMGKAGNGFPAGLAEFQTSIRDEGKGGQGMNLLHSPRSPSPRFLSGLITVRPGRDDSRVSKVLGKTLPRLYKTPSNESHVYSPELVRKSSANRTRET